MTQAQSQPQNKDFRRPILEILSDLQKPIPQRFIKAKSLKGNKINYVPWYSLNRLLDFYCPGWDWEITQQQIGERTVTIGKLTVKAAEGEFTRSASGCEDEDCSSYGDPSSNSEAMAFRRCCAKFGLGLALWEK